MFCIELSGVDHYYGDKQVLAGIDLSIPYGSIYGLLGPSGGGKTTLVKIISGILAASAGDVRVLGQQVPQLALLQEIGYMSQADALYQDLTAYENIKFFGALYGMGKKELRSRSEEILAFTNLTQDRDKIVTQFSGGMKRRLSLAIAILARPRLLLLDEPTVGIDPILRKEIWNEFRILAKGGTTILVTTHVMDEAEKCDQLAMIRGGVILATGSPAEIQARSQTPSLEEAFLHYGGIQGKDPLPNGEGGGRGES